MKLLLLYSHLAMQTLVVTLHPEVSLKIKLISDRPIFMWEMGCEMERSTKETLSTDEQEEICPSLGNHNT